MEKDFFTSMITPDIEIFPSKEMIDKTQSDAIHSNTFSISEQVRNTLPLEAEPSWTPAKTAHTEAIRFEHRVNFLQGAIDNGITELWALQLERMPTFLTRLPVFKNEFYALRLKHARETMHLAIKHLKETAVADRRTAKTMKSAAYLLTEQTLEESEAKAATKAADKEWEELAQKTNHFELKALRERKNKMEGKVLAINDIIDPVNKTSPNPNQPDKPTDTNAPSTSSAQQWTGWRGRGRGGYRGRGRGRRNNNRKPYSRPDQRSK